MARGELKTFDRIYHSHIDWNIRNYFESFVHQRSVIRSPAFVTNLRSHIKWQLYFIPRRRYGEIYKTECILRRCRSCNGPRHIVVKVSLALRDSRGNDWGHMTRYFGFYPNDAVVIRGWYIYDIMENAARVTTFLNGKISVACDIIQDIPLHFRQSDTDEDLWALSNDLKVFYMIGNLTDLELKVHDETFSVHSAIVYARCPRVARILKKNPGIRKINLRYLCLVPVLKGLIVYWYSGDLDKLPKLPSVYNAADIRHMGHLELRPFVDPEIQRLTTTIKISNRSMCWVIEDFQFCEQLKHLQSDIVHVYKCEDLPWKLHIYPKGIEGNANYFTLNIIEENCVSFKTGYLDVFVKDEYGLELCCNRQYAQQLSPRIYTFPKFMTHDEFFRIREKVLNHNILRVGCRITYPTGYLKDVINTGQLVEDFPLRKPHPYTNLANDLKRLFKSAKMSDISLKSGNRTFKVHSAILAARSRYFQSLFINRQYETSKSDIIIMDDVEPDDLDMILNYVYYAEKIVLNSDLALKLYPVFNKYKITRLEKLCSDYLQNNISENNVLNILKLADKFDNRYLKQTAQQFVKED